MSYFFSTVHITDLDKLNLVEVCYDGLVLGSSQLLLPLKTILASKVDNEVQKSSCFISLNPCHTLSKAYNIFSYFITRLFANICRKIVENSSITNSSNLESLGITCLFKIKQIYVPSNIPNVYFTILKVQVTSIMFISTISEPFFNSIFSFQFKICKIRCTQVNFCVPGKMSMLSFSS